MQNFDKIIARRITEGRNELSLSQKELAALLSCEGDKVSPARLGNWEAAIRTPKYLPMSRIVKLYDTTFEYMMGLTDVKKKPSNSFEFVITGKPTISIDSEQFNIEDVPKNIGYSIKYLDKREFKEDKLLSVYAPDQSMKGKINQGDEILIDTNDKEVKNRDIFALLIGDRIWLRWVRQEMNGTYLLTCEDEQNYPPQIMSAEELKELKIIGRVVRISRDR